MKKLLFLTIVLFFGYECFAQTIQPSKQKLNYFGNSIFLDEHSDFHQNNFVFSWHWFNGYKMSSALGINQIHIFSEVPLYPDGPLRFLDPDIDRIAHNTNMIVNTPYIGHHWHPGNGWFISHNIGFMYEPTYKVDTSNPSVSFQPRKYDTTRYAFGFANVKGFIDTTFGAENYNRLQLFDNDSIRNQIVLSEPWISNGLKTIVTRGNKDDEDIKLDGEFRNLFVENIYNKPPGSSLDSLDRLLNTDWKGVNFYFNINLRRLNTSDTLINNDTILEIRLPYTTDSAATFPRKFGFIKFDSIPKSGYTDFYNLPNGRGLVREMFLKKGDTVIFITRSMLPKGNETNKDITISAFFVCDNRIDEDKQHNYGLKGFPFADPNEQIDSLKIEVKYRGNCDVGIDFISITTRPTRELLMGYFDNTIKNKMQESLDSLTTTKFTSKGIKPYRWYLVDEPPPLYWITRHYFTKLLGKVFTFEGGEGMPQYYYYCNNAENWFGQGGQI